MPDGNSLINLGDLSKPVNTLIEKISDAIGVLYEPRRIRLNAKAEGDASFTKALSDLKIEGLQQRALKRFMNEETQKQLNIESIAEKSFKDINEDAKPENIENDWIANFFDKCKLISDNEMQTLWGKVLAGEANSPGKFSKRTIEFMSTMSKDDASSFQRLCRFKTYFNSALIIPIFNFDDIIYSNNVITQDLIRHLESIGLINYNSFGFQTEFYGKIIASYYNSTFRLDFSKLNKEDKTSFSRYFQIGVITPTLMGTELCELVNPDPIPEFEDYLKHQIKIQNVEILDMR